MADQPQSSIFNGTNPPATPPNPQVTPPATPNVPSDDAIANLLSTIKNERGEPKYKNLEDALNGLKHAQEYIPSLKSQLTQQEQESQRLREEAGKIAELERSIAALTSQNTQPVTNQPPVFDENMIAELVTRTLTQRQNQEVAQANIQSVVSTLQQSFGVDAEAKFYEKAKEYGMTQEEMNALAAKSPKAVLTMLGVSVQTAPRQNTTAPTNSTVNTSAYQQIPETFVQRNNKPVIVGATSQELIEETRNARKMADELHAQGKTVHDLTNPKVFFQYFK